MAKRKKSNKSKNPLGLLRFGDVKNLFPTLIMWVQVDEAECPPIGLNYLTAKNGIEYYIIPDNLCLGNIRRIRIELLKAGFKTGLIEL